MLNCDGARVSEGKESREQQEEAHLEDDVLGKDVLDAGDDVLRLALGELDRLAAALEDRAVRRQLGYLGKLLGVRRLALGSGRFGSGVGEFGRGRDGADGFGAGTWCSKSDVSAGGGR